MPPEAPPAMKTPGINDKQPDYLSFRCSLSVEAAAPATDGKLPGLPQFRMVAYTGGLMKITGFPHPVVVDLEGLEIPSQNLPIRLDHERRQGVGHTQRVLVDNGRVLAEGLISRDTSWARDVARSGTNGFPWQASIGAAVIEAEMVPAGQQVKVNDQSFTGPVHVVRRSVLKEISFVDSGADAATSARIAAQDKETHAMSDNNATTPHPPETPETPAPRKTVETTKQTPDSPDSPDSQEQHEEKYPGVEARSDEGKQVPSAHGKVSDSIQAMRAEAAAESKRIAAIRSVCKGSYPEIEAKAIEDGWDESRTELHVLRASRPQVPAVVSSSDHDGDRGFRGRGVRGQGVRGPGAGVRGEQVFEAVALMASGLSSSRIEASYDESILEAADKLRGVGIQEFCELASGQHLPRFRRDASGWLEAAFSTTTLPGILSNVANKMLLEGYNYVEDAWRSIAKVASVNDFKQHTRYRMTGSFQFEQIGPDGELKHGQLGEQTFSQKADTHGIMFGLTRQMIINDDMGAFTDIPRQIGMGAAEAIADAVWGLWLANPVQPDGQAFFHAGHNNYKAGADTALSVDGLTAAEVAFGTQVKPSGKPLGIRPATLLVPTALKVPAEMLMKSVQLNETTSANKAKPAANPHVGKFGVVSSVYLSNSSFSGASDKAWYLLADPNRLPAIEVAFLNGVDRPTVEKTDADFNRLGVMFRGYIDFGVKEQDYRGALKMKGEA
ncbi:phage major capsid protein [Mucisphaera calidilacus]|uniref:Mu-like prophage major head subunit gpT n=1 Tax=Mucisphaera calidilacus TaxID=2527982 RepID=A0A518BVP2_9BACT|nr:Mu-like prophage major head subunit gpT family protein [Mucisphaera calidilacus]QDU71046.1 Mu-like prophage major head subunit gpT [Mucisphaera calidilacus]